MGALHITFIDEKQKDTSMRRNFVEGLHELFENDPDLMGGRMVINAPYSYKGTYKSRRFRFFEGDDCSNENEFLNLQKFLHLHHDPMFNQRRGDGKNLQAERAWDNEKWNPNNTSK